MSLARSTAWTLLVAAGFALLAHGPARAQDALPKKPNTSLLRDLRDQPRGGIPATDLKAARASFAEFATYFADVVKHPAVWKASLDVKFELPKGEKAPTIEGPEGILTELDRFLIIPGPGGRLNLEPADYVRELGAALDKELRNLIDTHPERIVKVNAARVLAHVARSGAPAHFVTAKDLLGEPNTPTEVKNYMFQVAAAALTAFDPLDQKTRKHSVDPKTLAALVKVLQDCVTTPSLLVTGLPAKIEDAPADQLAVVAFMRRQAVRALAQVKFATIADGKNQLYPAHTLARVALSDPALVPAPGPAECAEAVIGICNMAPPPKGYNVDVATEAVVAGLYTFAAPRAANFTDRTLPWRSYALRLGEALYKWRPLFDQTYDITKPTVFDPQSVPALVEDVYKEAAPRVLARIEKADPAVNVDINVLRERLKLIRENPKRNTTLFAGVPQTSVDFAPKK
jgi:hypothetical protein